MPKPRVRDADRDGMSLRDVGKELGISAERVRQIEIKALAKLARWCARNNLRYHHWVD